jgi:hypothetical protein
VAASLRARSSYVDIAKLAVAQDTTASVTNGMMQDISALNYLDLDTDFGCSFEAETSLNDTNPATPIYTYPSTNHVI